MQESLVILAFLIGAREVTFEIHVGAISVNFSSQAFLVRVPFK
jgi:hypothetical protein